jgi:hypothetical protein
MPRKSSIKLDKNVSSKIPLEDYQLLEKYCNAYYSLNLIELPTMSHLLRRIIGKWCESVRKPRGDNEGTSGTPPYSDELENYEITKG